MRTALVFAAGLAVGVLAGFLAVLALFTGACSPALEPLSYAYTAGPVSTSHDLAAKLAPRIQGALNDARPAILSRANFPERVAVKAGWGLAMREVPVLTEEGLDALAEELSAWTIADVMRWIEAVAEAKKTKEAHAP